MQLVAHNVPCCQKVNICMMYDIKSTIYAKASEIMHYILLMEN